MTVIPVSELTVRTCIRTAASASERTGPRAGLGARFLQFQFSLLPLGEPFRPLSRSLPTWKTGKLPLVWCLPGLARVREIKWVKALFAKQRSIARLERRLERCRG